MLATDWNFIRRAPIFGTMSDELLRSVIGNRKPRRYRRGEIVFQQDDPADSFFLVIEGWIKVYRVMPDGEEVVIAMFTAGQTFAEWMLFQDKRYPVSAEAVSTARLLRVDGQALRAAIMENPQLSLDVLAAISRHVRQFVEQVEQLRAQSAPKRIAGFLLDLTNARSGPAEVALPYEKTLIANRLGMKPESLSRALAQLRSVGVTVAREHVRIDEVRRLAAFAGAAGEEAPCAVLPLQRARRYDSGHLDRRQPKAQVPAFNA